MIGVVFHFVSLRDPNFTVSDPKHPAVTGDQHPEISLGHEPKNQVLSPRPPVVTNLRRWDWGGCQEGLVIPFEEVLGGVGS